MKKPFFLLAAGILFVGAITLAMSCSDESVPQAVQDAFSQKFPKAKKVKWEEEGKGVYEAEFFIKKQEMSANFKADGSWLETEMRIKKSDLPAAVIAAISTGFAGYEIEKVEQIEKAGKEMAYEVDLENEATDQEVEVVFSADGKILYQKVEDQDDEDEDDEDGDDDGK